MSNVCGRKLTVGANTNSRVVERCCSALGWNAKVFKRRNHAFNFPRKIDTYRGGKSRRVEKFVVRASVEEPLYGLAQGVVAFGLMLGISVSALPLITGHAKERNERRYMGGYEGEMMEDNVRWSVMSVTSCLPYLNYLGWVFGALYEEEGPTLYWVLSFLYFLPYVMDGFRLDGFTILTLCMGVVHMQIERIAQTEPVQVSPGILKESVQRHLPESLEGVAKIPSSLGDELGSRIEENILAEKRGRDKRELERESRRMLEELRDFDGRLHTETVESSKDW